MRAVLLDALGTLVELKSPWPALVQGLCAEHGIELDEAQAEEAFGAEMAYYRAHHHEGRDAATLADLRGRCAEVLHAALPPAVAGAISVAELEPLMLGALRFAAYPEAPEVLGCLRDRGLKLVVASNWDISLHETLVETGLHELLDGAVTSAEVGAPKPAPDVFRAALQLAGVAPEQAVHVGDSPEHDVPGALAAGIAPVLVCRVGPPDDAPRTAAGVPVLSSLLELAPLLF